MNAVNTHPHRAVVKAVLAAVVLAASVAGVMAAVDEAVKKELIPTGKLRVGVAFAPAVSPLFVVKDGSGQAHGPTVDLGKALGQALDAPVDIVVAPNTGELTDGITAGTIDVAFMPADEERRQRVDFGPAYFVIESTYMVPGSSDIKSMPDVDRPNITVVGVANTTTIRAAGRTLKAAKVVPARSIEEAMEAVKAGTAQALALTHDALEPLQRTWPGSRVLDGAFQRTGVAPAVQKNHPAALAFVSKFLEEAKANGTVRKAFESAGLGNQPIAPPESQK
jgi:polar amino acid transport system substrate-binding protein